MNRSDLATMDFDGLIAREWLCTNGLGGYAAGTIPGLNTRKYHGLLVAAMAPPVRRMVILSRVEETLWVNGRGVELACNEYPEVIHPRGDHYLRAFDASPFPRWAYQGDGWTLQKHLRLVPGENTGVLSYMLLGGDGGLTLDVRPLLAMRDIHALSLQWGGDLSAQPVDRRSLRIPPTSRTPEVFLAHDGEFASDPVWYLSTIYRRERERGYSGLEDLWSPGTLRWTLEPGMEVHLICSTDPIDFAQSVAAVDRMPTTGVEPQSLVAAGGAVAETALQSLAAFRLGRARRMHAPSPTPAIMTSYPWGLPSIRDALIGFAGSYLLTHQSQAGIDVLAFLSANQKDGLIPTHLDERGGLQWKSPDVSLWFVHAVGQLAEAMGTERPPNPQIGQAVQAVIAAIRDGEAPGTRLEADGLLTVHGKGFPPTWMDAELDDWAINPRQGRPVEVNALWFNAVRVAGGFAERGGNAPLAAELHRLAARIRHAFNARFWNESAGCCYDVLTGSSADNTIRPNQVLAVSLPFPVLDPRNWEPMLDCVAHRLLTPMGLRTLDPADLAYRPAYRGDVLSRDRAQHNGSVYAWLLAHYLDARARITAPGPAWRESAATILAPLLAHLLGDGMGHLPELFDGDPPHTPGGSTASGVAAAELLRAYATHVLGIGVSLPTATAASPAARPASDSANVPPTM